MNVYLIIALFWLVSSIGIGWKAFNMGEAETKTAYLQRDLADSEVNAAAYRGINARYRSEEQAKADASASISKTLQERLTNAEKTKTLALNAVRAGTSRLRDPAATNKACGSTAAAPANPAGGRDGTPSALVSNPTAGLLSSEASQFLVSLASEADAITIQLNACQDVLESERK